MVINIYINPTIKDNSCLVTRLWSNCILLLPSLVRSAVVSVLVVFSLLCLHFSLTSFSTNSLQFLLHFVLILHYSPTLSRHLIMQSSHRNVCFPGLLSRQLSGPLVSWPVFYLSFHPHGRAISTNSSPISSKPCFTPTSTLSSSNAL